MPSRPDEKLGGGCDLRGDLAIDMGYGTYSIGQTQADLM